MRPISPDLWNSLAEAAAKINLASEEMAKSIAVINLRLKELNLGLTVWMPIQTNACGSLDQIGYGKLHNRWGLLIKSERYEWHFNDAPRSLRLEAVNCIPDLLQRMTDETVDITGLIEAKLLRMRS